jgi:hypothetical protein
MIAWSHNLSVPRPPRADPETNHSYLEPLPELLLRAFSSRA